MAMIAHRTALNARVGDQSTVRDSYEVKATRARRKYGAGSPQHRAAVEALEGPDGSDALAYLEGWSDELFGRSGFDANGIAPMTWVTLDAWARRAHREPLPHEVDALFALDGVRLHPPDEEAVTNG